MRDDLFPSGIYYNQEDATNEARKEMQEQMDKMKEEMQGEIDDKQYTIDIMQEGFDEQYTFFEEIKEKYFESEKPKPLTIAKLKKELKEFNISRRAKEWNVLYFVKEAIEKIEPEIEYKTEYIEKIVYQMPLGMTKIIQKVIELLNSLIQ